MKLKLNPTFALALLSLSTLIPQLSTVYAQGTTFTYQGRLDNGGVPFTGSAEFQATLWDAAGGGNVVASNTPAQVIIGVTNGLFVLPLDFGSSFPGSGRWLQLEVRTTLGPFTTLTPRQQLTPTPYALTASNLSGTLPAAQLSGAIPSANLAGTYPSAVTFNNAANSFTGTHSGSGSGLTGLNASQLSTGTVPDARLAANLARTNQVWLLGGNTGTTSDTQFVGTTDNQSLEFRVGGVRGFRIEPDPRSANAANLIGGYISNRIDLPDSGGSVIVGGGYLFGENIIRSNSSGVFIGAGSANVAGPNANDIVIVGGVVNSVESALSSVGGGEFNRIMRGAGASVIAGGAFNFIATNSFRSVIGGGYFNTITTNAQYATIPGGHSNTATNYAFAAGRRAKAIHQGAFVWADSQNADYASTGPDQVSFRCLNGVRFGSGDGGIQQQVRWTPGTGTWAYSSDRNLKENFKTVDGGAVLKKVCDLPITEWNYRGYEQRHIGPMAQDFHAAFPLNDEQTTLNSADLHGVALAAIQGLNQKLTEELQQKESEITKLQQRLAVLEKIVLNQKPD